MGPNPSQMGPHLRPNLLEMVPFVMGKVREAQIKVQLEGGPGHIWFAGYDSLGMWPCLDLARFGE